MHKMEYFLSRSIQLPDSCLFNTGYSLKSSEGNSKFPYGKLRISKCKKINNNSLDKDSYT